MWSRLTAERLSFFSLWGALFIAPWWWLETWRFAPASRFLILSALVVIAALFYLWSSFRSGELVWPGGRWVYGLFGVGAITGLTWLAAPQPGLVWWGSWNSPYGGWWQLILGLVFFLTFMIGRQSGRRRWWWRLLIGAWLGFVIWQIIFWTINYFWPESLPSTPIDFWFDAVWLAALALIASLGALDLTAGNQSERRWWLVAVFTSAAFLLLANQIIVWFLVVLFSLWWSILRWRFSSASSRSLGASVVALILGLVVLIFLRAGQPLGDWWSDRVGRLVAGESVATWVETGSIIAQLPSKSLWLGVGAGRWADAWRAHRPAATALSADGLYLDPDRGPSTMATIAVENGLLGSLSWLVFSVVLLWLLLGALWRWWRLASVPSEAPEPGLSLSLAVFVLIIWWLWPLGLVGTLWAAAWLGLGFGLAAPAVRSVSFRILSWRTNLGFYSLGGILALMLVSALPALAGLAVAEFYNQRAERLLLRSDRDSDSIERLAQAEAFARRAVYWRDGNDDYWRVLTAARLNRLDSLVRARDTVSDDALADLARQIIEDAKQTVDLNPVDARNWFALGYVYEFLATAGLPGAWPQAAKAYEQTCRLDPEQPLRRLALAKALTQSGDAAAAEIELEKYLTAEATDPWAWLRVAYLFFEAGAWERSAALLEQALALDPDLADARFLLALSEEQLGYPERALANLRLVAETNPDHPALQEAIRRLTDGSN